MSRRDGKEGDGKERKMVKKEVTMRGKEAILKDETQVFGDGIF
jgi:hypothetical protein